MNGMLETRADVAFMNILTESFTVSCSSSPFSGRRAGILPQTCFKPVQRVPSTRTNMSHARGALLLVSHETQISDPEEP